MIFYFDENSRKLEELKDKTIPWKPGLDPFFGYFLDSVQKLFAGVDRTPGQNLTDQNTPAPGIPHTHAELLTYLGGHKLSKELEAHYQDLITGIEKSPSCPDKLPERFDWRDREGKNYITPVKQQGFASSCVAFGITAAMEAVFHIQNGIPAGQGTEKLDLSEQHLYFYNKDALAGTVHSLSGWNILSGLDFAYKNGVLSSSDFCAYNPYNKAFLPPQLQLPEKWKENVYTIDTYRVIQNEEVRTPELSEKMRNTIKKALIETGPVITKIALSSDYIFYTDGVYTPILPTTTQDFPSPVYHCILIIGYDDEKQAWLCKNSFGAGWGIDGYFWNMYGKAGIEDEVYVIEGVKQGGAK